MRGIRARVLRGLVALVPALCACSARTHYAWGGYETALYVHYKQPQDLTAFTTDLREVMLQAEQSGGRVPPGLYAEYGYALLEAGKRDEAALWFKKESDLWPEAQAFMAKMIKSTSGRPAASPAGPRSAAPAPMAPPVAPSLAPAVAPPVAPPVPR